MPNLIEAAAAEHWARLTREFELLHSGNLLCEDHLVLLSQGWFTYEFAPRLDGENYPLTTRKELEKSVEAYLDLCRHNFRAQVNRGEHKDTVANLAMFHACTDEDVIGAHVAPGSSDEARVLRACLIVHEEQFMPYEVFKRLPRRELATEYEDIADAELLERIRRGVGSQEGDAPGDGLTATGPGPAMQSSDGAIDLDEALRLRRIQNNPSAKTASEGNRAVRLLREWLEEEAAAVSDITRRQIIDFRNDLVHLPKSLSLRDRELPLPQLLDRFREAETEGRFEGNYPRISRTTVNKYIGLLHAIFAVSMDDEARNPARRCTLQTSGDGVKRRPFKPDELRQLFTSGPWARPFSDQKPEQFWMPLLALWTGARLEELAQLRTDHLGNEAGVSFIDVADDAETNLKNANSVRRIPLHPRLLDLRFLDFTSSRRAGPLFPALEPNKFGRRGSRLSKWFARHLEQIGLSDPALTFHSFRHGFITAATGRVDGHIRRRLTGHSNVDVHESYAHVTLASLAEGITMVDYEGVDFDHLITSTALQARQSARHLRNQTDR